MNTLHDNVKLFSIYSGRTHGHTEENLDLLMLDSNRIILIPKILDSSNDNRHFNNRTSRTLLLPEERHSCLRCSVKCHYGKSLCSLAFHMTQEGSSHHNPRLLQIRKGNKEIKRKNQEN